MKFLVAVFISLALLAVPLYVKAADDGVVAGKLINKTAGGSSVARVKVTLISSRGGSSPTTGTNDKGEFEFKGISTDRAAVYKINTKYQDVEYESNGSSFKEGETQKEIDLAVYDAVMDSKDIKINLSHIVMLVGQGGLQAQEFYALANTGDKSYTGSRLIQSLNQKETFRTPLPDDAVALDFLTGLMECCVAREQGSLIDTRAIIPGVKEIAFGYNFPYKSSQYTLYKTFEYPLESLNFVIEDKGIQVSGAGLTSQGRVAIEGKNFLVFNRKNIGANEPLKINVSGLPSTSFTGSLKWWALGFLLLAVAAVISYPRLKKRKALAAVPSPASEREKLIKQIARLDDDFEEGRIPEETYKRLRSEKKAHLAGIARTTGRKVT